MIKRMVLFMPPFSRYGVVHHFTQQLCEALKRTGIDVHLMTADYYNPKPFLDELFRLQPDCTLSFNGLLPDQEGRFFCDMIKIPHIAYLVDVSNPFLTMASSSYTTITCPDRFACDFFRGLNCQNVTFLPQAAGQNEIHPVEGERQYDVAMLATCVDYEGHRAQWSSRFPKPICAAMDEAVELTLADQHTPYIQAFVNALDAQLAAQNQAIDLQDINYPAIFDELHFYIRGLENVNLIRSIKDAQVHVWGGSDDKMTWKDLFADQPNVHVHPQVDFNAALDIMRQSKIVLNGSPFFKNGPHERIFSGLAAGALVLTAENIYLREQFKNDESILFYRYQHRDEINGKVNRYIADEAARGRVAAKGQSIVAAHHTWDQRAETIVKDFAPLLTKAKAQA